MDDETPSSLPENDNQPDVAELPPSEFKHWYCLSYAYGNGSVSGHACAYMGYTEMKITMREIEYAKHVAAPEVDPKNLVMVGASYLGYMTKDEMTS